MPPLLIAYDGGRDHRRERWHRDMRRLPRRHRDALPQLEHALNGVPEISPVAVAVFGGAIGPARLRFPFDRMPAGDARDWTAIRARAAEVGPLVAAAVGAAR